MAIVSKPELIKRIMIGEMLINPEERESMAKCVLNPMREERIFKEYFNKIKSNEGILHKRRMLIKDYVEKNFKGKTVEQMREMIRKELKATSSLENYKEVSLPILVDCLEPDFLGTANYDLRLGEDVYVTTEKVPTKLNAMGRDGFVSIEPGEFGILMTYEYIFVPLDLMGLISIRLTHKQKGLVNISGFHADPGFYGRLMFAVFNAGPNDVPLRHKERAFIIMFNKLMEHDLKFEGSRWSGMETIPVETLSGLRGTSVSVRNLDERIRRLEMVFPIVATGVVSIVIAVITWVLTHW